MTRPKLGTKHKCSMTLFCWHYLETTNRTECTQNSPSLINEISREGLQIRKMNVRKAIKLVQTKRTRSNTVLNHNHVKQMSTDSNSFMKEDLQCGINVAAEGCAFGSASISSTLWVPPHSNPPEPLVHQVYRFRWCQFKCSMSSISSGLLAVTSPMPVSVCCCCSTIADTNWLLHVLCCYCILYVHGRHCLLVVWGEYYSNEHCKLWQ